MNQKEQIIQIIEEVRENRRIASCIYVLLEEGDLEDFYFPGSEDSIETEKTGEGEREILFSYYLRRTLSLYDFCLNSLEKYRSSSFEFPNRNVHKLILHHLYEEIVCLLFIIYNPYLHIWATCQRDYEEEMPRWMDEEKPGWKIEEEAPGYGTEDFLWPLINHSWFKKTLQDLSEKEKQEQKLGEEKGLEYQVMSDDLKEYHIIDDLYVLVHYLQRVDAGLFSFWLNQEYSEFLCNQITFLLPEE